MNVNEIEVIKVKDVRDVLTKTEIVKEIEYVEKEVYPELENLHVIPTTLPQEFKSITSYGYNKVIVDGIQANKLVATPSNYEQTFHGLFKDVEILTDRNLLKENIKDGVSIFGVRGNLKPQVEAKLQEKTITPTTEEQIVVPDLEFDGLSKVVVEAMPEVKPSKYKPRATSISFQNFDGTDLDYEIANLDTSLITDFSNMFKGCNKLENLDVSQFDTSNAINMGSMFENVRKVTSLDLSNFDTSKVTNMTYMFASNVGLTQVDLSNFNTTNVTNMNSMFDGCNLLTSLDLSNFNITNVTNMSYMFRNCKNLTRLDLRNLVDTNVTNVGFMFYGSNKLEYIDIRNFTFSKTISFSNMFGFVPTTCVVVVKDESVKELLSSKIGQLPTIKTLAEYQAEGGV